MMQQPMIPRRISSEILKMSFEMSRVFRYDSARRWHTLAFRAAEAVWQAAHAVAQTTAWLLSPGSGDASADATFCGERCVIVHLTVIE